MDRYTPSPGKVALILLLGLAGLWFGAGIIDAFPNVILLGLFGCFTIGGADMISSILGSKRRSDRLAGRRTMDLGEV